MHVVVATGVVIKDGKFLAGQRAVDEPVYPEKWAIPGGKVEENESLEEGLRQEIREEAGVEIKNIFYATNFSFTRPDNKHVIGIVFGCEYDSGEVTAGDDMDSMDWFTVQEFAKKDVLRDTVNEVKKAFEIYDKLK